MSSRAITTALTGLAGGVGWKDAEVIQPGGRQPTLQLTGVAAEVSQTAGTFVCNQVFYTLQHGWAQPGRCSGFVHLPCLPEQVTRRQRPVYPSMALSLQVQAVRELTRIMMA